MLDSEALFYLAAAWTCYAVILWTYHQKRCEVFLAFVLAMMTQEVGGLAIIRTLGHESTAYMNLYYFGGFPACLVQTVLLIQFYIRSRPVMAWTHWVGLVLKVGSLALLLMAFGVTRAPAAGQLVWVTFNLYLSLTAIRLMLGKGRRLPSLQASILTTLALLSTAEMNLYLTRVVGGHELFREWAQSATLAPWILFAFNGLLHSLGGKAGVASQVRRAVQRFVLGMGAQVRSRGQWRLARVAAARVQRFGTFRNSFSWHPRRDSTTEG